MCGTWLTTRFPMWLTNTSRTCGVRSTARSGWCSWKPSAVPATGCWAAPGRRERFMSLRLRLALLFAAVAAAVVAVAGAAFLWQLRAAQIGALDAGLRVRADALAAQVRTLGLTGLPGQGGQQGQHQGEFSGTDEESQVLTAQGRVVYDSAGGGGEPVVTGELLPQAGTGDG